jgi:hypothetical protein
VVLGKLECTTVSSGFRKYSASASCASGYNLTGGACDIESPDSGSLVSLDGIPSGNTYNCDLHAQNSNVSAYAFCCKVQSAGVISPISTFDGQGRVSYDICGPGQTGASCRYTSAYIADWRCDSGYVISSIHQNDNGASSWYIDRITCSPVPYMA